jgi:hypothetical protein
MQNAMPRDYVTPFITACNDKLNYFITADELLGYDDAHPISELNEIFDLSLPEFKTMAIKINPYKRIALFYDYYVSRIPDPDYTNYTECTTLTEFLDIYLNTNNPTYLTENSVNASLIYISGNITVSYLLDFDTFNTDVKTIPEFQNVTEDYLTEAYAKLEGDGWKELYTDADKARVAEVFAKDIVTWNYTF